MTPSLSLKISSPQKPTLTRPLRLHSRARSPELEGPASGNALFPTRTIVSLSDALTIRTEDASAGSSSTSPFRARSSTTPEKLRGIRSVILPTTRESQYRCFYLTTDDKGEAQEDASTGPPFWNRDTLIDRWVLNLPDREYASMWTIREGDLETCNACQIRNSW